MQLKIFATILQSVPISEFHMRRAYSIERCSITIHTRSITPDFIKSLKLHAIIILAWKLSIVISHIHKY